MSLTKLMQEREGEERERFYLTLVSSRHKVATYLHVFFNKQAGSLHRYKVVQVRTSFELLHEFATRAN